jgi:Uma2 family endonuclease
VLDLREIAPETPRLLTRAEYEHLVEVGSFEGERVELLEGVIIRMSPISPEHASVIDALTELLVPQAAGRARVRVQNSFAASDASEPQPDFALVPSADYSRAHPTRAFLIIEVANSSLAKDRGLKARVYARSDVAEYWVVNLVDGFIEVFSDARDGLYRHMQTYLPGETVVAKSIQGIAIAVSDVIPRG